MKTLMTLQLRPLQHPELGEWESRI